MWSNLQHSLWSGCDVSTHNFAIEVNTSVNVLLQVEHRWGYLRELLYNPFKIRNLWRICIVSIRTIIRHNTWEHSKWMFQIHVHVWRRWFIASCTPDHHHHHHPHPHHPTSSTLPPCVLQTAACCIFVLPCQL